MPNMNQITIIGHLGADPELRFTKEGQPVANMSVATSRKGKDRQEDLTEWHRVTIWGKDGEAVAHQLRKGEAVIVIGRIQTRKWTDRDGNDRYSTDVVADVVGAAIYAPREAKGERSERGGERREDRDDRRSETPPQSPRGSSRDVEGEDVPF